MDLKAYIRDIPDFPSPGILFRDITPLLGNPKAFQYVVDQLAERYRQAPIDAIVAVESRGFIFGAPLACRLDKPLVLARKEGKLPYTTIRVEYALEYGMNVMEMHVDGLNKGSRALLIDDLLATGGTLAATARLVEMAGGVVAGIAVVIELGFLNGRQHLEGRNVFSLTQY